MPLHMTLDKLDCKVHFLMKLPAASNRVSILQAKSIPWQATGNLTLARD